MRRDDKRVDRVLTGRAVEIIEGFFRQVGRWSEGKRILGCSEYRVAQNLFGKVYQESKGFGGNY